MYIVIIMLYNTCPTCGFFIGNITKKYEEEKDKICNNPELKASEIEEKLEKLIMSVKLRRYCCRMRLMTYKNIVEDISAPINE